MKYSLLTILLFIFAATTSPLHAQQLDLPTETEPNIGAAPPRDPTMPSDRILQQLPRPEPLASPAQPTTGNRAAPRTRPVVGLPPLPEIKLRGLVQTSDGKGTAMLTVDGRPITVDLVSPAQQQKIPLPKTQFASYQAALKARAAAIGNTSESETGLDEQYELVLGSSFFVDGILFNLKNFTSDTLVFEALPHRDLIIVR